LNYIIENYKQETILFFDYEANKNDLYRTNNRDKTSLFCKLYNSLDEYNEIIINILYNILQYNNVYIYNNINIGIIVYNYYPIINEMLCKISKYYNKNKKLIKLCILSFKINLDDKINDEYFEDYKIVLNIYISENINNINEIIYNCKNNKNKEYIEKYYKNNIPSNIFSLIVLISDDYYKINM